MEVIYSLNNIDKLTKPSVVALGTFDGLHLGHMELINTLMSKSKLNNYNSVVYTFSNHPREVTIKKNMSKRILSNKQKIELFEMTGIDILVFVDFDELHKDIKAEDFITNLLIDKLNMRNIVVGFDCRFGKNAEGNVSTLKELSQIHNFELNVILPVKLNNKTISSSLIRKYLSQGRIEKVNEYLGRNYSVYGDVIKGKQLGSKLGFPTANILANSNLCLPKPGVYITKTYIDDNLYYSTTNVGFNPTFNQKTYNIETYIIGFNDDIYGKEIKVVFYKRIRDELKFKNIRSLCKQIENDVIYTKQYFGI